MAKNVSSVNDHQIRITLDLSGVRSNAKQTEKDIQQILDSFKNTVKPTVDFSEINKLKSELKELKAQQIIELHLNTQEALKEVNNLANNLSNSFSKAFNHKVVTDSFSQVKASALELQKSLSIARTAMDSAEKSMMKMEETGKSSSVGGFRNLNKRINELKTSLDEIGGADGSGFEKIQQQAAQLVPIISSINEEFVKNPIRFHATFDAAAIKSEIKKQNTELKSELSELGLSGITFTVRPTLPEDYRLTLSAVIDPVESAKRIQAEVRTLNALLRSEKENSITFHVNTEKIREEFSSIPIDISFTGNFEEKINDYLNKLKNLKETAGEIKVNITGDTEKGISKQETTQLLSSINAIYEEIKDVVGSINGLKNEGIKLDREAIEVARAKAQAEQQQKTDTTAEDKRKQKSIESLKKAYDEYVVSLKEAKSHMGTDAASDYEASKTNDYKQAAAEVERTSKRYQRQLSSMLELDPSVATQYEIVDKDLISIQERMEEIKLHSAFDVQQQSVKRFSDSIEKMNTNVQQIKSRMQDTSKDQYFTKFSEEYDKFQAQLERIKNLEFGVDENGNFIDLTDEIRQLKEYESAAKEAFNEVKRQNAEAGVVAKDADKMNQIYSDLISYMNKYGSQIKSNSELYQRFIALQNKMQQGTIGYYDAKTEFAAIRIEAKRLGVEVETLWDKMKKLFQVRGRGLLAQEGWMLITIAMRDVVQNVRELDAAMTELRKVTDATAKEYDEFLTNASARAKEIGATLVDTVSATSDMARLGYDIPDASALADTALIYKNVGDGIDEIDEASESIISTMQAFNIEAEDSISIVDKFNAIGNNFATTSGDVGEALKRSASAMESANNSLDETIALYTAAQTTVQDADVVGRLCA